MEKVVDLLSKIISTVDSSPRDFAKKTIIAVVLLYCFSALLIFPYNSHTYRYGGPITLSFFIIYYLLNLKEINPRSKSFLQGGILIFISSFFFDFAMLGTVILFVLIGSFADFEIKKPLFPVLMKIFIWACFFSIIHQLRTYQAHGHSTLSVEATNYSGMYLLLYFFLCKKYRFYLGEVLCIVASYLISSRNFVYSLIVFYFFDFLRLYFSTKNFFAPFKNYIKILIISNFLIAVIAYFAVEVFPPSDLLSYNNSKDRILEIYDGSAFVRLQIIMFYFKSIANNWLLLFKGFNETYLTVFHQNIFSDIHNSFLAVLARYGIVWAISFFCYLNTAFSRFFNRENIPFLVTHTFFGLFLHTLFETQPLLIFFTIIMLPRISFSKNEFFLKYLL